MGDPETVKGEDEATAPTSEPAATEAPPAAEPAATEVAAEPVATEPEPATEPEAEVNAEGSSQE